MSDPAHFIASSSFKQGGTIRWMSPELIVPEKFELAKSRLTTSSDCYALAMVVYETISGDVPFHEFPEPVVYAKVMLGEHPSRGAVFPDDLWKMMELCWTSQPNDRPSIADVLQCLRAASGLSEPSPRSGGETEIHEDDRGPSNSCHAIQTGASGAIATEKSTPTSYDTDNELSLVLSPPGQLAAEETDEPGVDIYGGARNPNLLISPVDLSETGTHQVGATSFHTFRIPRITYCTASILICPSTSGPNCGRCTLPFPSLFVDCDEIYCQSRPAEGDATSARRPPNTLGGANDAQGYSDRSAKYPVRRKVSPGVS